MLTSKWVVVPDTCQELASYELWPLVYAHKKKYCKISFVSNKLGNLAFSEIQIHAVISSTNLMPLFKFHCTVKILKFGTPQTIAIIVLKIEKFDVTLH